MHRPRARLELVALEDRSVPAATALLEGGILHVFGTQADDTIALRFNGNAYTLDGVAGSFPATQVQSLQVLGYGGNDAIDLRTARVPVAVDAGAGYDAVVGGYGNDAIVGGDSDDLIFGGDGNDAVDGGDGNDRIYGEGGNDSLIGGAGVNTIDGGAGTNIIVEVVAAAVANDYYSAAFADPTLENMIRSDAADHWIDRAEVLDVYAQAAADGTVSAEEFDDINRLVRPDWTNVSESQQYGMADSVRVLGLMVAAGDRANATFQGTSLGNLRAGSSGATLSRLAAKWFLGQDRPAASGTYRLANGSLFVNGPSYTDVVQGGVGDCYYLAALGETAQASPESIRQMFTDNGDGTFTVRFFRDGSARYVTVDRYLPASAGRPIYAGIPGGELWVALAEKAYAQINESGWIGHDGTNSYRGISGGWSDAVFRQTLAVPARWKSFASSGDHAGALASLAGSYTPTVLASRSSGTANGIVPSHAYGVLGYNGATGRYVLYNPWGSTVELSWAQIAANFVGYWTIG